MSEGLTFVRFIESVDDFSKGAVQEMMPNMADGYIYNNKAEEITEEEYEKVCLDKQRKRIDILEDVRKRKEDRLRTFKEKIGAGLDILTQIRELNKEIPVYYDKNKIWWIWSNELGKWEITDETDLINTIEGACQIVGVTKSSVKSEIINALKMVGRKNNPIKLNEDWLHFKNKLVNIETGEETEPASKYFLVNPIEWNIGESEETPVMDKLFTEWTGEDNKQLMYEIIAYSLYREYPIHRLFCFVGKGRNGKSKYLSLISKFLGKNNVASTEISTLSEQRFESFKLYKKLACQMGESNYTTLKNTGLIKKLTGQDLIGFEKKGKDGFDDYNYAKIMISTNSLPATTDKTEGFYRRWLIIDFPNQFEEGKDILKTIPKVEYENLAKKCINLLKNLLDRGKFDNEKSIAEKEKVYEEKSNPLKLFLSKYCESSFDGYISKREFNDHLITFLKERGFNKFDNRTINAEMRELNYEDKKKGQNGEWSWVGIVLKTTTSNTSNISNSSHSKFHRENQVESTGSIGSVGSSPLKTKNEVQGLTQTTKNFEPILNEWQKIGDERSTEQLLELEFEEQQLERLSKTGIIYQSKPGYWRCL